VQHDVRLVGELGEERHHLVEPAAVPPPVPHVGSSSFLLCAMEAESAVAPPPVPHADSFSFLPCPKTCGGGSSRTLRWLRIHGPCDGNSSSSRMIEIQRKEEESRANWSDHLNLKLRLLKTSNIWNLFCLYCRPQTYGDGNHGSTAVAHVLKRR
jgi:hypothetical protein